MDKDEQQIAIAEVCGWRNFLPYGGKLHGYEPNGNGNLKLVPDYTKDLNAMHEAEKILKTDTQQNRYYGEIADITWGCEETGHRQVVFNQLVATASQRAEAFLRTMNLWK